MSFQRWWVVALLLGVVGGLLWWGFTDTATWTVTDAGAEATDDQTRRQFGMVVHFVVIGGVLSLLLGFLIAFASDVSWPAVPIVAAMCVVAAVIAWQLGELLGPDRPTKNPPVGTTVHDALTIHGAAPVLAWAVFGVAGLLVGVWMFEHEGTDERH